MTIITLLTDPGEIVSTATVSGSVPELDPSDNTVTLVTQISPAPMTLLRETDLAVTATATPDPIGVGGDLAYTLTVTNQGPDTAQGVVVSDTLPADVQLVSVTATRSLPPADNRPLRVRFDYTYDGYYDADSGDWVSPFFDTQEKKDLLQLAADYLLSNVADDLAAIVPGGENHWTATFTNPATGRSEGVQDLSIETNELLVFVGGCYPSEEMHDAGEGGPGGVVAWGSAAFVNTVRTRGEVGATGSLPTDFGPWGGSIAFNLYPSLPFHFGDTTDGLDVDELDFLSVAMHELAHVLGLGTADAWRSRIDWTTESFVGSFGARGVRCGQRDPVGSSAGSLADRHRRSGSADAHGSCDHGRNA